MKWVSCMLSIGALGLICTVGFAQVSGADSVGGSDSSLTKIEQDKFMAAVLLVSAVCIAIFLVVGWFLGYLPEMGRSELDYLFPLNLDSGPDTRQSDEHEKREREKQVEEERARQRACARKAYQDEQLVSNSQRGP